MNVLYVYTPNMNTAIPRRPNLIPCWTVLMYFSGLQVSCLTPPLRMGRVGDNSIKCSSQKDHAFWSFPFCKPTTPPEIYNDKTDSC